LALVSSEMPIEGRGVLYHQPMDPIAFKDPREQMGGAASFVNCMPSMGACWDLLRPFAKPEWEPGRPLSTCSGSTDRTA
jgi:hypothetical protein